MAGLINMYFLGLIMIIASISLVSGNKPVLACYVDDIGGERLKNFDPNLCTHIIYYDFKIAFNESVISINGLNAVFQKFNKWRKSNPSLQIIVSAYFDSAKKYEFNSILLRGDRYWSFIHGLCQFLIERKLDGFNLHYNYIAEPENLLVMQTFLQRLKQELKKYDKIFTTTIIECNRVHKQDNLSIVSEIFRFIFVMCGDYDLEYMSARQSWLSTENIGHTTANNIIEEFINLQMNLSSLVLGIELRAHVYETNKQDREFEATEQSYDDACQIWKNRSDMWQESYNPKRSCIVRKFDNITNMTEIFYNSPLNMESKIEFVEHHEIAGVMMWPVNKDDVFDICEEEYSIFHDSVNFPILRSARKYIDEILTRSWKNGFIPNTNIYRKVSNKGPKPKSNKDKKTNPNKKDTNEFNGISNGDDQTNRHTGEKLSSIGNEQPTSSNQGNAKGSANKFGCLSIGGRFATIYLSAIFISFAFDLEIIGIYMHKYIRF